MYNLREKVDDSYFAISKDYNYLVKLKELIQDNFKNELYIEEINDIDFISELNKNKDRIIMEEVRWYNVTGEDSYTDSDCSIPNDNDMYFRCDYYEGVVLVGQKDVEDKNIINIHDLKYDNGTDERAIYNCSHIHNLVVVDDCYIKFKKRTMKISKEIKKRRINNIISLVIHILLGLLILSFMTGLLILEILWFRTKYDIILILFYIVSYIILYKTK
jgi:hypothetical protein